MKKYYKVKFGFEKLDYVSVDEIGLQKAIYAKISKRPVQLGDSMIDGSRIWSITPHYHKYTGWNEFYEPKEADDFLQIKRDCPNLDGFLEDTTNYVTMLIQSGRVNEIGKAEVPMIESENKTLDMVKVLSESKRLN